MTDPFEYDVFISFSSADEEIVKPIWQELCSNGLRVFWSDSTLKKEIGNSWFEVIEKSLERSKHMLLVCSDNSINSKWVQREYRAFFDYCYSPNSRRLIPLLTREFPAKNLPLFLRELQVGKVSDSNFIHKIIPILGGVNIENLQQELKSLQEQVNLLSTENESLNKNIKAEFNKVNVLGEENKSLKEQLAQLWEQNSLLNNTANKQEKLLSLSRTNIERLQQERQLLQEQVNSLSMESELLNENTKAETNNINVLIEENKSLNKQLTQLKKQNRLLSEKSEEKKNILLNENALLKKQATKPNDNINSLTQKTPIDKAGNTGKPEKKKYRNEVVVESNEEVIGEPKSALKLKSFFGKTMYCSECGYNGLKKSTLICPRCKRSFASNHLW